jgi:hypothetical protein
VTHGQGLINRVCGRKRLFIAALQDGIQGWIHRVDPVQRRGHQRAATSARALVSPEARLARISVAVRL